MAFGAWSIFYKMTMFSTKEKTFRQFIESDFYAAFVRFAEYCVSVKVVNIPRYTEWLVRNKVKIDEWNRDSSYNTFLIEYLRHEDPLDALARSIEYSISAAEAEGIHAHDCMRVLNANRLCLAISSGRISPWALFHSTSGKEFLDGLSEDQVRVIYDYINPEQWALVFHRYPERVTEVKELLRSAGW